MDSLPGSGISVVARKIELEYDRVYRRIVAKSLTSCREAELCAKPRLSETENGVIHTAQQGIGDIFSTDRINVRMANQSKIIGMVSADIVFV